MGTLSLICPLANLILAKTANSDQVEGSKGLNWRLSVRMALLRPSNACIFTSIYTAIHNITFQSNIVSESGIIMGIVEAMQSQSGN